MKRTIQKIIGAALLWLLLLPQTVWAADIDIKYKTPESAKAGDTVKVEIDISGSKPITTLGLRLTYDSDKLTYESEAWSQEVKNANAMTLVSDVEGENGKVLNISMVSDKGFQGSGTMVTLTFSVKADYAAAPVELVLRDITDKDMQDVSSVTTVTYQKDDENNTAESSDSGSISLENTESGSHSSNAGDDSAAADVGGGGSTVNTANAPKAYQTGVEIMDSGIVIAGGLFLAAGSACIFLKRRLSR